MRSSEATPSNLSNTLGGINILDAAPATRAGPVDQDQPNRWDRTMKHCCETSGPLGASGPVPAGFVRLVGQLHALVHYYLCMDASSKRAVAPLPADQVALAVEVFRMLADGTRIQILWALIGGEMPVNDLAAVIGKPGPSVSQHLAKLRMARLVRTRREGTQIFYQLENDHVRQLIVDAVHNAEHAGPAIPAHHLVPGLDVIPIPDSRDHDAAVAGGGRG